MTARLGDSLQTFLEGTAGQITLIAPFIKVRPLRRLLVGCEGRDLRVYTRWLPTEVAAGVSDLETLEYVEAAGGQLHLLRELHAKAFIAGGFALVGSANITDAALGWSNQPNLETLVRVEASDAAVSDLLQDLQKRAVRADKQMQSAMERAAEKCAFDLYPVLSSEASLLDDDAAEAARHDDGDDSVEDDGPSLTMWIPETSDPVDFVKHHVDGRTMSRDAEVRAARDLRYLDVQPTDDAEGFFGEMRRALRQTGFIAVITKALDASGSEDAARDAFFTAAGLEPSSEFADDYWQHVVGWLLHFFPDRYERVAVHRELRPVVERGRYLGSY